MERQDLCFPMPASTSEWYTRKTDRNTTAALDRAERVNDFEPAAERM